MPFFNGDNVAQGAAAQGIADKMAAFAHMHLCHGRIIKIAGDQCAPRHLICKERRGHAIQCRAGFGLNTIGANQNIRRSRITIDQCQMRARACQINGCHLLPGLDADPCRNGAGGQQINQIGAVDKMIGLIGPQPCHIQLHHHSARSAVAQLHRPRAL